MSDQPTQNQGIASFFEQESKKKKQQTKQQTEQQRKAEEQKKKAEEEKKASQTAATGNGDYESGSEEEETRGKIDVGAGKVKDIKEVKKAKEAAKDAQKSQGFDWSIGGAHPLSTAAAETKPKQETQQKDKQGFSRDQKKPDTFSKDGIKFGGGRPQFKKSEHVGNKGDFPELGDEHKNAQ